MYPAPFAYLRARTLKEAEERFAASSDARYLSGGMTLIPTMKLRLAAPTDIVDLNAIPDLSFIRDEGKTLHIGAGTHHADVAASSEARRAIPALAHLASMIGDPAVRHRGTLGGSIANNDPAADYPAAVLALGASVLTSRRSISGDEFFTGMFSTALEDGEIVTSVAFPVPARAGYAKFPNPASRYAMVGVFVAQFEHAIRVAVTGAAPCVFRAQSIEAALSREFTPDSARRVAIDPNGLNSDLHASAEYRAHLVGVMASRAVASALV